jgi:uncharacterized protein
MTALTESDGERKLRDTAGMTVSREEATASERGGLEDMTASTASPSDRQAASPPRRQTGSRPLGVVSRWARLVVSAPIVLYQRAISPALPRRCKYEPTCSRYAVQAIRRYGVLRGTVLAGWRLLRCNPWSYGGYDPVEAQRLFEARPYRRA